VTVDSKVVSSIGKGILVFAAIGPDDTSKSVENMASKILKMRLWADDDGKMVRDVL
jgi:D-aminoacyl-tRNA deacylase